MCPCWEEVVTWVPEVECVLVGKRLNTRVLEVDCVLCRQLCWEEVTGRRLQQPSVASSFQPVFLSAADAATAEPRTRGSTDSPVHHATITPNKVNSLRF